MAAEEEAEPEPEGPKEMTLDEWKALQGAITKKPETNLNLRKAGEGVDDKQWKKTYVLKKKVGESEDDEEEESDEVKDME